MEEKEPVTIEKNKYASHFIVPQPNPNGELWVVVLRAGKIIENKVVRATSVSEGHEWLVFYQSPENSDSETKVASFRISEIIGYMKESAKG